VKPKQTLSRVSNGVADPSLFITVPVSTAPFSFTEQQQFKRNGSYERKKTVKIMQFNQKLSTVPASCRRERKVGANLSTNSTIILSTRGSRFESAIPKRTRIRIQDSQLNAGEETDFVKFPGLTFLLNKILVKVLERGNADPNRSVPFLLLGGRFFQLIPIVLKQATF
jgi:hypothetical protein